MSNSSMVWATKYQLLSPLSLKDGKWDKNGAKKELKSGLVSRQFVEDRNSHDNNELYVIDEEKTAELMKQREVNSKLNVEKAKREQVGFADLVEGLTKAVAKPLNTNSKSSEPDESWTAKELKEYCKDNNISFRGNPGKDKLLELINSNEEE